MATSIEQPPTPHLLLASLRNTGYTLKSAIADIIDNSITAMAKNISIQHRGVYRESNPWIAICDDGVGMNRDTLFSSMRFGSRDLNAVRLGKHDLGRFGLGLKTASISQCRRLSVFSWQNDDCHAFCWDLDAITDRWCVQELSQSEIYEHIILKEVLQSLLFSPLKHGTVVLWEKLDRENLCLDDNMSEAMSDVKRHIAEVFHRFMQPEQGYPDVIAFDMNRGAIAPASPFGPVGNINRYVLNRESFKCCGQVVEYQPYILPKAICYEDEKDYLQHAGEEGYHQNQGFYVYRNRRLIEKGTWFRKRKKEHKTQLLRIQLDVPAELDEEWGVDVRKSQTTPPEELRRRIDSIVNSAMDEAKKLWDSGQRNTNIGGEEQETVWRVQARPNKGNQYTYKINPDHTMYKLIAKALPDKERKVFTEYINLVSELFPYERYYSDRVQNSGCRMEVDVDADKRLADLINNLVACGLSEEQVRVIILKGETIYSPELVQQFLKIKFQH